MRGTRRPARRSSGARSNARRSAVACSTSSRASTRNCSRNSFIGASPQNIAMKRASSLGADRLDEVEIRSGGARSRESCGTDLGAGDERRNRGQRQRLPPRASSRKVMPSICGMLMSTISTSAGLHQQLFQRLEAVERLLHLEARALQDLAIVEPHRGWRRRRSGRASCGQPCAPPEAVDRRSRPRTGTLRTEAKCGSSILLWPRQMIPARARGFRRGSPPRPDAKRRRNRSARCGRRSHRTAHAGAFRRARRYWRR